MTKAARKEKPALHSDVTFVSHLKVNNLINPGKLARFPKKAKDESTVEYLMKYHPNNKQGIKSAMKREARN